MNDKEQILEQPGEDIQRMYQSVIDNDYTLCRIAGRKKRYKIRWLRYGQMNMLSRLLLNKHADDRKDGDQDNIDMLIHDNSTACKAAAIYTLGSYWKLKLMYWIRWRWFYYVREYSYVELQEILTEGKKKIPQMPFYATTTLLIGAKATLMTMRAKEVEAFLQEQDTVQRMQSQKSDNG